MNVEGTWLNSKTGSSTTVNNELDLVLVHNNQMLIGEVKTINWESQYNKGKGQDISLKLESLSRSLGGAFGQGNLFSFFGFNSSTLERLRSLRQVSPSPIISYEAVVHTLIQWREKVSKKKKDK